MKAFDRREFFKIMGGGIFIFLGMEDPLAAQGRRGGGTQGIPSDFNAFLHIGEDGRVTGFTGKIEMGQGIVTSLAQMLAEELDVPLESVKMVMGDTDLCPYDMGTFGSRSTKYFGPLLRQAAAEAKAVLLKLASSKMNRPPDRLVVGGGKVRDRDNPDRALSYGELTQGKRIEKIVKGKVGLKPPSEFRISGKATDRTDGPVKVTGQAQFAGDIRLPGMLYARILRPPVHGAALKKVDVSGAMKIKGLRIVQEKELIAVLHPHPEEAMKGLEKIKAQYAQYESPDGKINEKTIFTHLMKVAPEGNISAQGGDLAAGRRATSQIFEKAYFQHYVAHAPLETHTALAQVEGEKATLWASTQRPYGLKEEVAQVLGMPAKDVRVITPFVGGGFGGKTWNQQAIEAARLAKIVGKPVQVAWSREEEFFYDTFQPAAVVQIRSGLGPSGRMTFWDYHVYFAGERASGIFYDVPHHRTTIHGSWWGAPGAHPFSTGAWRGPASNTNTFARESHIDLMSISAKTDPLVFRLNHLGNGRMKKVLEKAAAAFQWENFRKRPGRGRGVACVDYLGTYVAAMSEVEVDRKSGKVEVKRIVCAQDMGQVINPEGARMQMEGCMMMGLGYALSEKIHFQGGKILDRNFDTYEIPRFSWLPRIEAVLVENPDLPPQGGGEPAITCMGAVVANAIHDAVGIRLTELPMTPDRVKTAMAKSEKRKG